MPLTSMEKLDDPVYSVASECFYLIEKRELPAEEILEKIKIDLGNALRSAGVYVGWEIVHRILKDDCAGNTDET